MKTVGMFFGKFAPLTTGHVSAINRAAGRVDELYVVLCYDEKFNSTEPTSLQKALSLNSRFRALVNTFKHMKHVHVTYVDETPVPSYPEGSEQFTDLVRHKLHEEFKVLQIHEVFSSEIEYAEYFSTYWPKSTHVLIDPERKLVDISATKVRSNPYQYWDYLSHAAKRDFVKKVCIIGVESTGKSTLTKNLANHFSTVSVEEVGRTMCEDEMAGTEKFMSARDYEAIAVSHKVKEYEYSKIANKVLFSDTNNLITLFSMECQGITSAMVQEMAEREEYDLVIMLDTDVQWVYDPLRTNSTDELRASTFEQLKDICTRVGTEYVQIGGTYNERYNASVELVNNLLGEPK